jgi:hypothetical protein
MYSGKIAVPPGGGGIRKISVVGLYISYDKITILNILAVIVYQFVIKFLAGATL